MSSDPNATGGYQVPRTDGSPQAPYQAPYSSPAYGQQPPHQPYGQAPYQQPYGQAPGVQPGYLPMARPIIDDPSGPDSPLPGATPAEAFTRFWQRWVTFSGRASRSEYWWATLINSTIWLGLAATASVLTQSSPTFFHGFGTGLAYLTGFYMLACIIPSISLQVRRLHDTNNSGLLALMNLFPYLGQFVILIITVLGSRPEGARFDRINRP